MSMQAMARWLGGAKKVAPLLALLAAGLAALAALGLAASAASAATFSNNSGITINDAGNPACRANGDLSVLPGPATPYPSGIEVSGLSGSVSDVNVTLSGLSHTFPDDIGVLLVGPEGQKTILMTDVGGFDDFGGILTFDDAASGPLPDEGPLSSGTYQPTRGTIHFNSCQAPSSFPDTAPAGPYDSSLSVFDGSNPNGTWQLYVIDDTPLELPGPPGGSITGWSLDMQVEQAYDFTGFFSPVDNPEVATNKAKAGSAIPVKFSLGGDQGLDIFESGYPKSGTMPCDSTDSVDAIEQTVTAGSSSLSYDATTDTYTYVWKTNKAWAKTCRQLMVKLNDGSTEHVANFEFVK